ncbi:hypothetical protein [Streptomyces plumbiresistens]|uniref:Transposase n=1 Tax=Streptomyces plumbiresistens TaxID=511811 RepID=A0ABP7TLN8_9ACTN
MEYGPWQTIYGLFRRWQRAGIWVAALTGLQDRADAAGLITWEVNVDSTICRAHQHAAGARREGKVQRSRQARSAASWTTMGSAGPGAAGPPGFTHLVRDQSQRPLSLLVTAGRWGDVPEA